MTLTTDPAGNAARARLMGLLDSASSLAGPLRFWWRDDDAETITDPLERLLELARRHALPLGLAVIPAGATEALAARLAEEPELAVLQHGWRHKNHSPAGEKKAELGDHRPLSVILHDLAQGLERLAALFPDCFLPVLVPPWNRIGPSAAEARRPVGLTGMSTYGNVAAADPHWVNTHVDIFRWKPQRRPLARAEAFDALCRAVELRISGDQQPIGLLTHHLVHDEASWTVLEEILELLTAHPAAVWPPLPALFELGPFRS